MFKTHYVSEIGGKSFHSIWFVNQPFLQQSHICLFSLFPYPVDHLFNGAAAAQVHAAFGHRTKECMLWLCGIIRAEGLVRVGEGHLGRLVHR